MADTSMVELADLIEQVSPTRLGAVQGNGEKATRKGNCPWCGGTDRFAVFTNAVPMHYHCGIHGHGCGAHGDAITFLREYSHVNYREACELLFIEPGSEYSGPSFRNVPTDDKPPSDQWQAKAIEFCKQSKNTLWSDTGKNAVAYLVARGFTEETLKAAGIGYNPTTRFDELDEWNIADGKKKVWLPRGITIPWMIEGSLWKVSIRRPDPDIAIQKRKWEEEGRQGEPAKYVSVTGGGNGLYGVDDIREGQPLVVCEGEFDRLIFKQVTSGRVASVATGSTSKGREEKWTQAISVASPVLVAFDYDAGGKKAFSDHWHTVMDKAVRWSPWAHDLNDMHKAGMSLNEWIDAGIEVAGLPVIVTPPPVKHVQAEAVPATNGTIFYHELREGPYMDKDGVPREYTVTYLSHQAEPDICASPFVESILVELAEFEADSTLMEFDMWDVAETILVAKFRKRSVEGTATPAQRIDIGMGGKPATHNKKASIPPWLVPGDSEWKKQVERVGLVEMKERRAAWFASSEVEA